MYSKLMGDLANKDQQEVYDYVKSLLGPEVQVDINNRDVISRELGIYVPSLKVAIECNNLYSTSSASTNYVRGMNFKKAKLCHQNNIKLFAFFEDEWHSKQELIKAMIRWRLDKFNGTKLNARDCELVKLDKNNLFKDFFDRNHLDGSTMASYAFGLFFEGKLVQCLSLRNNFNKEVEIARLATDYDYCVRGGFAKLLSQVSARPLTTFSNNRLSFGDIYIKNGFQYIKRVEQPSYWYTDLNSRVWRYRCKRINKPEILEKYPTEVSQATNGVFSQVIFGDSRPLYRIEDYGHKKFVMEK